MSCSVLLATCKSSNSSKLVTENLREFSVDVAESVVKSGVGGVGYPTQFPFDVRVRVGAINIPPKLIMILASLF